MRFTACALADELLTEIRDHDYNDADVREAFYDGILSSGVVAIGVGGEGYGPGTHEAATGNRSLFDDVDDYHGWSASPPQAKDGTVRTNLAGWTRSVSIVRLNPNSLNVNPSQDLGLKRITVVVSYNGSERCRRVAHKSLGLLPKQACCMPDTSCVDVPEDICGNLNGVPHGWDTKCRSVTCAPPVAVLMVVQDPASLTVQEAARKTLIESWGYTVTLIDDSDVQIDFVSAAYTSDVAYVSEQVDDAQLASKLVNVSIGVLLEKWELTDEFGFSNSQIRKDRLELRIDDNSHYITSEFSLSDIAIFVSAQPTWMLGGAIAPDVRMLGSMHNVGSGYSNALNVLEAGDDVINSSTANGRRVKLPWGDSGFDINELNADGETIMQRAPIWAAGMDVVCGDATCVDGEDSCTCPTDCGAAAVSELPGVTCDDGMDNDCDAAIDCADANCGADPACSGAVCGNGTCELGEDCYTCWRDCARKIWGNAAGRYCCGDGTAQSAEGDGTICDGNY